MIPRSVCEHTFERAIAACDPRQAVRDAVARYGALPGQRFAIAVGKSAQAMARGIGVVGRGLAITHAIDGEPLPTGWRLVVASHPVPDERSVEAGRAALALARAATASDHLIVAISGGASSLIEVPQTTLAELTAISSAVMAAGAPIKDLNLVRSSLSAIKSGRLALACPGRVITLAASDVIGDKLDVIGSGPTFGPWLEGADRVVDYGSWLERRRRAALEILERERIDPPASMRVRVPPQIANRRDRAEFVIAMSAVAREARRALAASGFAVHGLDEVMRGQIPALAARLATRAAKGAFVAFGEPTIRLPHDHGVGGRAQQLALELARQFRGTDHSAFVAGTDGKDGPATEGRPSPAGAYVDGATWQRLADHGIDGDAAIARCDAGTALHAIEALFVSGPTGINHADLVIVG